MSAQIIPFAPRPHPVPPPKREEMSPMDRLVQISKDIGFLYAEMIDAMSDLEAEKKGGAA